MEFDYIIAGGGSAGCVLANRLSEDPSIKVCLVEAGGNGTDFLIRTPSAAAVMLPGRPPINNWAFRTVPQPGLNGRRGYQPRGKTLGGSSAINAMLYVRGHPGDYDDWAALGATGWGWDACAPWFRHAERNQRGPSAHHGAEGPLQVADQPSPRAVTEAFLLAADQAHWPRTADFNGADQEGAGLYQVTQFHEGPSKGERCSAAAAYLDPARRRDNLTILTGALVDRVVFDRGRATRLVVHRKGQTQTLRARREIISALGAFGSPALLQRSGIGPAVLLREQGIAPLVVRDAVGANLQDHLSLTLSYTSRQPSTFATNLRGGLAFLRAIPEWRRKGTGPLTTPYAEGGAFLKTTPDEHRPDIQIHFIPAILQNHARNLTVKFGYSCQVCVLRPDSRGTVQIASRDASTPPLIDPAYLSAPGDLPRMIAGARMMQQMMENPAFAPWRGKRLYPHSGSDADWEADIRTRADTIYHPVGTCRMGTDQNAVTDPAGRVRGITGLRIVDASLLPRLIGGNTNAPVIMMAERLAQTILTAPEQPAPSGPPRG